MSECIYRLTTTLLVYGVKAALCFTLDSTFYMLYVAAKEVSLTGPNALIIGSQTWVSWEDVSSGTFLDLADNLDIIYVERSKEYWNKYTQAKVLD